MRVGTAGWNIPPQYKADFPEEGSHLARYASRFSCVEINSSFYRPHRPATYARWAASVPRDFRFAVKMPKEITHTRKLVDAAGPLTQFLGEVTALGDKLGPILIQLPPSLHYEKPSAGAFFSVLRDRYAGDVVCEPRHAGWFTATVNAALSELRIARVAADPPPVPGADQPGGWKALTYRRQHGSPQIYYSAYGTSFLNELAATVRAETDANWCIFDNTARGEAANDAKRL